MTNLENVLILDNIRSVLNVGSIFRTADAVGINKIFLCGITPTPIDRFGRKRNDLHKSALGAEDHVSWEYVKDTIDIVEILKKENFNIISIEQNKNSVDYKKVLIKQKNAIILGNEVEGISTDIQKKSDVIAEIKMNGKKESLNVGVTAGIVLYRFFDK